MEILGRFVVVWLLFGFVIGLIVLITDWSRGMKITFSDIMWMIPMTILSVLCIPILYYQMEDDESENNEEDN